MISVGIGLAAALHGIKNKKWQEAHTMQTFLGVAGAIGPELFA
jgi:hypothetical protein